MYISLTYLDTNTSVDTKYTSKLESPILDLEQNIHIKDDDLQIDEQ